MPSAGRKHKTPQEEQPDESDASDASLDGLPDEIDPYETLNLTKEATEEQVKKAYRKAALVNHPDKVPAEDKEHATERFKKVAFAYAILSDPAKRKRYDTTGRTDEAVSVDDDFNWTDYYQELYTDLVTPETITRFIEEYKGSDEERQHVLNAYSRFKGDMTRLYEHVMASNVLEDDSRFRTMIDQAIKDEEVESHSKYVHETEKSKKARIRKAEQEATEAEEELKDEPPSRSGKSAGKKNSSKKKDGGLGDLAALIQRKQEGKGDAFLDKLAEKYGAKETKSGKKRGSAAIDEPPEEAFAKNRKRGKAA